jgi:hypothetical protein
MGPLWTISIEPLLVAMRPRAIGVGGVDRDLMEQLEQHATATGCGIVGVDDDHAEVVIVGPGLQTQPSPIADLVIRTGDRAPSAASQPGRRAHHIDAFGGLHVSVNDRALSERGDLGWAWERFCGVEHAVALCSALEHRNTELLTELEAAIEALEAHEADADAVYQVVERASVQLRALLRRVRLLERQVASANALAGSAQWQLAVERAWVSRHVRAVAQSQSWRVGHRVVRAARALALRGDHDADGLNVIVRRMEDGSGNFSAV